MRVELARCQSVDGRWARAIWRAARGFVHLPYVRAIVVGLSLVAIFGSLAALTLAVRHGVSAGAVYRYFVRPHYDEADLSRQLRSSSTALQLEPLVLLPPGVNPGGLVYAEEHGLVFYVHAPPRERVTEKELRERREAFERLMPLYWQADLAALAGELNQPVVRQMLIARGAQLPDLYLFQQFNGRRIGPASRTRLLHASVRLIQLIAPYVPEPFSLGFEDELRFYENHRPRGEFVGIWEVATPSPFGLIDAAFAHGMSRNNHYIVISNLGGRSMVSDFYQGVRRDFLVVPVSHPSGRTLYRLAAQPAS